MGSKDFGGSTCLRRDLLSDLEEGEIRDNSLSASNSDRLYGLFSSKKERNFWTRSKKRAKQSAVWTLANRLQVSVATQEGRIARLSQELSTESGTSASLRDYLESERLRASELEAELRSTEWRLISTERKLYVTTQRPSTERVIDFLRTAILPSDGGDVPLNFTDGTRDPEHLLGRHTQETSGGLGTDQGSIQQGDSTRAQGDGSCVGLAC